MSKGCWHIFLAIQWINGLWFCFKKSFLVPYSIAAFSCSHISKETKMISFIHIKQSGHQKWVCLSLSLRRAIKSLVIESVGPLHTLKMLGISSMSTVNRELICLELPHINQHSQVMDTAHESKWRHELWHDIQCEVSFLTLRASRPSNFFLEWG